MDGKDANGKNHAPAGSSEGGQFTGAGGGSSSKKATGGEKGQGKSEAVATLSGNELGDFGDDLKRLRAAAIQWYKDNLQGNPAHRDDLGEIRFSRKGRDEFESYSADPDKLKMIPALREMVESGQYKGREKLDHPRKDGIVAFHTITSSVIVGGKSFDTRVLIGEDKVGNLFYDLFPDAQKRNPSRGVLGSKVQVTATDSIANDGAEDTINISIIRQY